MKKTIRRLSFIAAVVQIIAILLVNATPHPPCPRWPAPLENFVLPVAGFAYLVLIFCGLWGVDEEDH